ncbi:MAG: ATP-binding cassette domain-containing protein [Hyphomicrobium sp.]|uniref:ATP-binding cassette domain-containing protein n=1 Tax=Hyphomicrobium sp. TaxID=82 RepID=UPI0039E702AE
MTSAAIPVATLRSATPPMPAGWSETVWLNRLNAVVGPERQANSPIAALLPSMLVALGWPGTMRTLAALLPPPEVSMSLVDLERLLSDLGFHARRIVAKSNSSDTARLRAGSLVQRANGNEAAVYLGQPNGKDRWLTEGAQQTFAPAAGDAILVVDPALDFLPVDEARPNWFRSLFERIRDELFAIFAMSTFINFLALTVSLYTLIVYSVVIPSGAANSIWGIAAIATVAVIGAWALKVGRQVVISRLGSWTGTRIGEAAMRKMLSFPLDVSTKYGVQNNITRMRSFENARQFLSGTGGAHLIDYPFVAIFLLAIALMGGWLVVVPIVSLLVYTALAFPTADYVSNKATAAGLATTRLEENATAAFVGIDAFYHAGSGSQWLGKFADYAREAAKRNCEYSIAVARAQAIGQALGSLTVLATMCIGILLVLNGSMAAGGLVASMMLIWRIVAPAQEAFSSLVRLRQIKSSVLQLDNLMATTTERAGVEIASPFGLANAAVAVERLYYRPDADQEAALNGVSFAARAGERVAVVGPNGGGKTALLECLAGLRRPQSGRVLVNGRDIRQFDTMEYRAWIGYVPQLVPALPITVREYLRLRVPTLRDEDALRAFGETLGPDWDGQRTFACVREPVLDRKLNPFNETLIELKFRYMVAFVAATLNEPAILLLDGLGVYSDPALDERIERYLDAIRGRTTVIWAPYAADQIRRSDQLVIIERGTVRHAGPTARPVAKAG